MGKSGNPPAQIALLRGINVGGNKKVPMATLRTLAERLGWRSPQTYVQSGNLVFAAKGAAAALEAALESELLREFGFPVPVVVRTAARWLEHAEGSPFVQAQRTRPAALHLGLAKKRLGRGVAAALQPYCTNGERVECEPDALWIDFQGGVARSKVTSAVLDRAVGSIVTLRNWNTVVELAGRVASAGE